MLAVAVVVGVVDAAAAAAFETVDIVDSDNILPSYYEEVEHYGPENVASCADAAAAAAAVEHADNCSSYCSDAHQHGYWD